MKLKMSWYNRDEDRTSGVCRHDALGLVQAVHQIPRPNGLRIWLPDSTLPRALWQTPLEAVLIH